MLLLDGKIVAKNIKEQLMRYNFNNKIQVVNISLSNDSSADIYTRQKKRLFEEIGVEFCNYHYPNLPDVFFSQDEIIEHIKDFNNDKKVVGIFIDQPIPKNYNAEKIINTIIPEKDIEGITNYNLGAIINKNNIITPCTAQAVIEILDYYNINVDCKHCVVIGRSNIVGKPLSLLLLNRNATVTICHTHTNGIKEICKQADIIIAACGQPKMIDMSYLNSGAIVIDAGINYVDNQIVGDVDFDKVKDKIKALTPVPGGVGSITTTLLGKNLLNILGEKQNGFFKNN